MSSILFVKIVAYATFCDNVFRHTRIIFDFFSKTSYRNIDSKIVNRFV